VGCDKEDGVPVAKDAEPLETAVFRVSAVGSVLLYPFFAPLAVGVDDIVCDAGCP